MKTTFFAVFFAVLLANAITVGAVTYLSTLENDKIHSEVSDVKTTISDSADKVATSISNFHIFGKH